MSAIVTVYAVLFVAGCALLVSRTLRDRRRAREASERALAARTAEQPPTLHPIVDPLRCMGSGACVRACPEQHALALVGGRVRLVDPQGCIGHGACERACPVEAISLVFGSARRGVDLPDLDANFQTNVPGLYIAGELGGMGLVANAVRQGVKAVGAIAASLGHDDGQVLPLLIVGAGPAGIGATLAAAERSVRCLTIERSADVGGAVRRYARDKLVMTQPVVLPLYGRVRVRRTTKEALIELWQDVLGRSKVRIDFGVTLLGVRREGEVLVAQTSAGETRARRVLMATGRRGQPRKLEAPGEHLPHVRYRLEDARQHAGRPCVVVGGGDSAIEAALALAAQPATSVVLCHRGGSFDRCRPANRSQLERAEREGALRVLRDSTVAEIGAERVLITIGGAPPVTVAAQAVFVLIGAELPLALLDAAGVKVETHYGRSIGSSTR